MRKGGALLVLAVALLPSVACGGRVSGDEGDAGAKPEGSAMAPADGGGQPPPGQTLVGPCPADAPQPDDPCVSPGQGCAYVAGSSCEAFVCSDSGRWVSSQLGC